MQKYLQMEGFIGRDPNGTEESYDSKDEEYHNWLYHTTCNTDEILEVIKNIEDRTVQAVCDDSFYSDRQ